MIEARSLTKSYGNTPVVNAVSFSIKAGEVVGLLGPNGAGKTTTMRMLTTFIRPSSGSALVAGYDIYKQADEVRRNIGYLPEHPPIYPELRVSEYLTFIAQIKGIQRKEVKPAVEEVVESCFLSQVYRKLCWQLSKGFRQRLGLAQAIIHKPKVIILDEPTSGLDPTQIIEIRKLIRGLQNRHTVVLSTHILNEVLETCSKVIIISNGQVIVQDSLEALTKNQSLEQLFLAAVSGNDLFSSVKEAVNV